MTRGVPRSLVRPTDGWSDAVACTYGYYPDFREASADPLPRVKWLLLDKKTGDTRTGSWEVPDKLFRSWLPRKTQLAMVEAFAAVAGRGTPPLQFQGSSWTQSALLHFASPWQTIRPTFMHRRVIEVRYASM